MTALVALVDDDNDTLSALSALLEKESIAYKMYSSGRDFLEKHDFTYSGCGIVDLLMPDVYGIDVIAELKKRNCKIPIVILTGYADIDRAVEAMKVGAFDFLQKPIEPEKLIETIKRAMASDASSRQKDNGAEEATQRLLSLSNREREVLKLIIEGNQSRAIATTLEISVHTVDNHRAHIMRKMRADSLADLVRITCLYSNRAGFSWNVT